MAKILMELFPIKAHFFFFFGALGPMLPQLNVFGKQLGASPAVMGIVTSVLPILWAIAKPAVGYVADRFQNQRKLIFTSIIFVMGVSFCGLYFLPHRPFDSQSFINQSRNILDTNVADIQNMEVYQNGKLYGSATFWIFVVLMSLGSVTFNVANCIGDAVCFDVLGPSRTLKYGWQRAWGTLAYGLMALLAGWAVDKASGDSTVKNFTPAFAVTFVMCLIDLCVCQKLKLPPMPRAPDLGPALRELMKKRAVIIFFVCATVVGIFDSFASYFMFWFLEELADQRQEWMNIKLLEGLTVAAQGLGGLVFFALSGKIINQLGFVQTMTLCLLLYGVRFLSVSLITEPWQIIPIELVLQGPTYNLCYSAIVGYAAQLAPAGLSATLQGLVAGVDDGLGFTLGGLLGGVLYAGVGGCYSFQLLAAIAVTTAVAHALLARTEGKQPDKSEQGKKFIAVRKTAKDILEEGGEDQQ